MDGPETARLCAWLDDERAHAVDPAAVTTLRRRLNGGEPDVVSAAPDGGWTCWHRLGDGRRRRLLELDRAGNAVTLFRWGATGPLEEVWVRIPPLGFVAIRAGAHGGRDEIHAADRPGSASTTVVGAFHAIDYDAIGEIPVLPEPGRLPPHAGTALLNVLATLASDSGSGRLSYRGSYPSEALFLALLESFRYVPDVERPLQVFGDGQLHWQPAPHGRWFTEDGLYVQRRARVEKVVWKSRAYYRPDWQGVARHTPRRIHETDGELRCSLWALGRPLLTSLRLDLGGRLIEMPTPPRSASYASPFDSVLVRGVESIVLAQSAPALGSSLRDVIGAVALEWGPVEDDLLERGPARLRVSNRLLDALISAVRATSTREGQLAVALALLTEVAALVGDELRGRAQAALLHGSPAEQAQALSAAAEPPSAASIAAAVDGLVARALAAARA